MKEILKLTFEKLGFREARLRIMNENADSKKLAERVGFRLDRVIENEIEVKGSMRTLAHYVLTDEEYAKIKAAVK
ncbi:MAG: GNAT family N-acetyltransferase [Clostridiales bacterium]|nr:GNAT family N-acetyltransferase [Candidatus Coliplasma equi]